MRPELCDWRGTPARELAQGRRMLALERQAAAGDVDALGELFHLASEEPRARAALRELARRPLQADA